MLLSRGSALLRATRTLQKAPAVNNTVVRNSHWYYREGATGQHNVERIAEFVGGFAWWWVLWHCWTEPGHIFGEFEYPDASQWTDAELGIPSE